VTKGEFDALVKSLNKLGLGVNDGDAVHRLQPARSGALLTSVFSAPLCWVPHLILFSTLERFKDKLRDVSDCIENAGYTGSNEDAKVASQLMDEIRAAIVDCQVGNKVRTGSAIHFFSDERSLLHFHPA
jgi:hypothetical protein